MVGYAIYDLETGEVLEVHVEAPGLNTSAEEITKLADLSGARRLGVVRMPEGVSTRAQRVIEGKLHLVDKDGAPWACAGASGVHAEPTFERRYEAERP
ncbi:hypothetical protein GCM10012275_09900 [Longimycelium tulufanense]|uniref:Uncharacterized protein n=1 Tax=Longimycelium tulufanense TaxID=907463 RepID=A0A8J3C8J6_9PSEU|nr:hypothetical protein [Longimycelium tulufanense]GGM40949.1 hypothetical protein GCM10012275_09900 [Longimycelium tulufanense]